VQLNNFLLKIMRYIITLFVSLLSCILLQNYALKSSGGRFTKSESNFFSSVGRLQAGAVGKPHTILLGSSITGRLPDRAQGYDGFANMGCDGGSAMDTLEAMHSGILPIAPVLIIEVNTLQLAFGDHKSEISDAMRRLWFRVGMKIPILSAYARPSAYFYSKLLERKIGDFSIPSEDDLGVISAPKLFIDSTNDNLPQIQRDFIERFTSITHQMKNDGVSIFLVWLPPARSYAGDPPAWIVELARRTNIPYWDLGQEALPGKVILTDGIHMAASSAARTIHSLKRMTP
jgi:hypothetical protein